ncbi:sugar transporter [Palleronia sp. LCG004]|uniref:sugar transporter n=1 Tax=Palleronia sp. LCG004 TaxID=3079304 RepID=UPI0029436E9F|nr:sugar transporter [Palleronia sp. LCG004]WOI58379.1 sugar transporter [Palleronia sp. LCG004]
MNTPNDGAAARSDAEPKTTVAASGDAPDKAAEKTARKAPDKPGEADTPKGRVETLPPGGKGGGGKGGGQDGARARVEGPAERPMARPARMQPRHWGLGLSFLAVVGMPLMATILYLWIFAVDQYASITGFTIRQEEGGGASELLGGLASITGAPVSSDADILYEFIQSQEMVREVDAELGLVEHYTAPFPGDPVFALWPDPSIEELQSFWQGKVQITFSQSNGLIEVQTLAFDPGTAHAINREIVARSQQMINDLNLQAREDAMRYANADLEEARDRLRAARGALTAFRTRTQIVDPEADMQGRMGVMTNLQQQLAEALIEYDLLQQTANAQDPRVRQVEQRIEVIRGRIADERASFTSDDTRMGGVGEDYPSLIAEYEGLAVDRQFAEETYRAALAAVDLARAKAQRQSRYLATYIPPTLPEVAEFPRRTIIVAMTGLFLMLLWAVMALVYYSIRDRG